LIPTKSLIIGLVIGISIILITGTPFQASTNHFEQDSIFSMDSKTKFVFAQTGGEVNGDTESQPPEEPPEELAGS
jgi:hypothetical protein